MPQGKNGHFSNPFFFFYQNKGQMNFKARSHQMLTCLILVIKLQFHGVAGNVGCLSTMVVHISFLLKFTFSLTSIHFPLRSRKTDDKNMGLSICLIIVIYSCPSGFTGSDWRHSAPPAVYLNFMLQY